MSVNLSSWGPPRRGSGLQKGISHVARTNPQVSSQSNRRVPVGPKDHSIMTAGPSSISPPTPTYIGIHPMTQGVDQQVLSSRSETLRRVQNAVRATFGQQYSVEVFGSTMYGVSSRTSDLDIVIIDPDRPLGFPTPESGTNLPIIYNIHKLAECFRDAGFRTDRVIPKATVPIVKFYDPQTRISCDINVNARLGLLNSRLLNRYFELSPLLRQMAMIIKTWAKGRGLNNPAVRQQDKSIPVSFSSYSLVLMSISLLQTRGLLPNLQSNLPPLPDASEESVDGVFWIRSGRTKRRKNKPQKAAPSLRCDARFNDMEEGWFTKPPPQDMDLEIRMALLDWFTYWGFTHNYTEQMASIRHGGFVPRPSDRKADEGKRNEKSKGVAEGGSSTAVDSLSTFADNNVLGGTIAPVETVNAQIAPAHVAVELDEEEEEEDAASDGGRESDLDEDEVQLADTTPLWMRLDEVERPGLWPIKKNKNQIFVIDPFQRTKNVTGSVSPQALMHFQDCCKIAATVLKHGTPLHKFLFFPMYPSPPMLRKAPRKRKEPQGQPQNQPPQHSQAAKPSASGSGINGYVKASAEASRRPVEQASDIPRKSRNTNANATRSESRRTNDFPQ